MECIWAIAKEMSEFRFRMKRKEKTRLISSTTLLAVWIVLAGFIPVSFFCQLNKVSLQSKYFLPPDVHHLT